MLALYPLRTLVGDDAGLRLSPTVEEVTAKRTWPLRESCVSMDDAVLVSMDDAVLGQVLEHSDEQARSVVESAFGNS